MSTKRFKALLGTDGDLYVIMTVGRVRKIYPFDGSTREKGETIVQMAMNVISLLAKDSGCFCSDGVSAEELDGARLVYAVSYPDIPKPSTDKLANVTADIVLTIADAQLSLAEVAVVVGRVMGLMSGVLAPYHNEYEESDDVQWIGRTLGDVYAIAMAYVASDDGAADIANVRKNSGTTPISGSSAELAIAAIEAARAAKH